MSFAQPLPRTLARAASSIAYWLAIGVGAGLSPLAPGTLGGLQGLLLAKLFYHNVPWMTVRLGVLVTATVLGVTICQVAADRLGRKDPPSVVWDEIVSMVWVFTGLPVDSLSLWQVWLGGLILHRFFDIAKLQPAGLLERLPGGWGIMADDLAAAAYANLVLQILLRWGDLAWIGLS